MIRLRPNYTFGYKGALYNIKNVIGREEDEHRVILHYRKDYFKNKDGTVIDKTAVGIPKNIHYTALCEDITQRLQLNNIKHIVQSEG